MNEFGCIVGRMGRREGGEQGGEGKGGLRRRGGREGKRGLEWRKERGLRLINN